MWKRNTKERREGGKNVKTTKEIEKEGDGLRYERKNSTLNFSRILYYISCHQIACFKVTSKSYNVATRTAEPRLVKTAQNLQRSKTRNVVLLTYSRAVRGGESFRGLEACDLVTATFFEITLSKVIDAGISYSRKYPSQRVCF
jgi:hypothetical protein